MCSSLDAKERNCGNFKSIPETVVNWDTYDDVEARAAKVKKLTASGLDIYNDFYFTLGNLTVYECPPKWITRDTVKVLDALHIFDKKNILPVGTSQADLPLWFMNAFKIYINEMMIKQES